MMMDFDWTDADRVAANQDRYVEGLQREAVEAERQRIAAWIREMWKGAEDDRGFALAFRYLADGIERGDHTKRRK